MLYRYKEEKYDKEHENNGPLFTGLLYLGSGYSTALVKLTPFIYISGANAKVDC